MALLDIDDADHGNGSYREHAMQVLKKHAVMLEEHFDTVQIVVTRESTKYGTFRGQIGAGNWYARYGSVREWLLEEEEIERSRHRQ